MKESKLTPGVILNAIRENQNNNKSLKALFSNQFLGKMSDEELEGLQASVQKELDKRAEQSIKEKIDFLEKYGYKVEGKG